MPATYEPLSELLKALPVFNSESLAKSKYYKGGFDIKMNKREAALILGISPTASKSKVSFQSEICKSYNFLNYL